MLWAIGLIGVVLPDDAGARLRCRGAARHRPGQRGRRRPPATWPHHCSPRRSAVAPGSTGGAILLAFIAAVAFATILAVVAGLTLTSASSVAHDLYANVIKKGQARRRTRCGSPGSRPFVIGGIAIVLAILGPEAQHRLPGGAGVRGRGVGQPAVAALQPVLEAVQHPRAPSGPSTAAWSPASCSCSSRRWCPGSRDRAVHRHRLVVVPAGQPRHHLDPGRVPLRLARHGHLAGARGRGGATPSSRSAP